MQNISLSDIRRDYNWIIHSKLYQEMINDPNEEFLVKVCSETEQNFEILFDVVRFWDMNFLSVDFWDHVKENYHRALNAAISMIHIPADKVYFEKFIFFVSVRDDRENIFEYSIQKGYLDIVYWAYMRGCEPTEKDFDMAVEYERLDIIRFFEDERCIHGNPLNIAVEKRNTKMVNWLLERGYSWDDTTLGKLAKIGDRELIMELRELGCGWTTETFAVAIDDENIDMLKWLKSKGCPSVSKKITMAAVQNGNYEILEWLFDTDYEFDNDILEVAAKKGFIYMVEEILTFGYSSSEVDEAFLLFAEHGHLDGLEWCLENGINFNPLWRTRAVQGGNLNVLIGLNSYPRFPEDENLCTEAAKIGDKKILIWLRENGYEWSEETVMYAAETCYECLRLCCENGCPYDQTAYSGAGKFPTMACMKYLFKINCPMGPKSYRGSIETNRYDRIQFLMRLNCPYDSETIADATVDLKMLKFFIRGETFSRLDPIICTTAVNKGRLDSLVFARQNGCKWDENTFKAACGNFDCLKYMLTKETPNFDLCLFSCKMNNVKCLELAYSYGYPITEEASLWAAQIKSCAIFVSKYGIKFTEKHLEMAFDYGTADEFSYIVENLEYPEMFNKQYWLDKCDDFSSIKEWLEDLD